MRVKIGNEWHDAKDQAICIELSKGEQRQIADIDPPDDGLRYYAQFPDEWGDTSKPKGEQRNAMLDWMKS